jgi:phage/plasmid-associated DNA primase
MTEENKKSKTIKILRNNNFNCFPVPTNTKIADTRYDASRTKPNQPIDEKENYGYVPSKNNCVIDFDHTKYNAVLDEIAKQFMVTKTAHDRRHLPVINLKDNASKIELFDHSIQDKKIIEIQGTEHYVIGSGSKISELGTELSYENIGTDVIFDANGQDFDSFVHYICEKFKVEGKKNTRNQHYQMRERFKNKQPPTKGTSNSYFYNASLQCNTEGISKGQAIELIVEVYDKWNPDNQKRAWSNIETTINNVYDKDEKISNGRKEGSDSGIDRTVIAQVIVYTRKLYSDSEDKLAIIYENKNGFLEPINGKLRKELQKQYPKMQKFDFNEIESKIFGLAEDMPERNKDLIVFRNGIYSISKDDFVKTDDIAHTGFRDYDYIGKNPNFKQFKKIMFENVDKKEHGHLKAGLASILKPYLDPKMTVVHGRSRVGKSTGQSIIAKLLGQYAMVTDVDKLLKDRPTQANLKGKLYVVIREITTDWEKVNQLKIMLGEQTFSGRKNFGDHDEWENTIKVVSSANNLLRIPRKEEDAMFQGRLSLIHNTRKEAYAEDATLESKVVEEEGSEILSYLVNLMQDEHQYADRTTTEKEWKKLANPEDEIIEKYFTEGTQDQSLFQLAKMFKEDYGIKLDRKEITEAFESFNFNVFAGFVKNCIKIVPKTSSAKHNTGVDPAQNTL